MLGYVRFDTAHRSCDCCGRTLKAGSVVLSDERHYGRDCAARALGRPKATAADRKAVDALECVALRAVWESTLQGTYPWKPLRFDMPGRGRTAYVVAADAAWEVFVVGDRLVGVSAKAVGCSPFAIGPGMVRYYDVSSVPALAEAVAAFRVL